MASRSVGACYCNQNETISRKKANRIGARGENRQPTCVVSKTSIINAEDYASSIFRGKGSRSATSIMDDQMYDTNEPSNLVLSPETSTALENAEKIISNAKIQLMEVCKVSHLDSTRRNGNIYSGDPPLDDEKEELLYIRELVASRFRDVISPRPEVNNSAETRPRNLVENERVVGGRSDLSAPKFRMSRRCADRTSPEHGSDERLLGRAPRPEAPAKDSPVENGAMVLVDRTRNHRQISPTECELVRADGNADRINACSIQIGPPVHVERELTRQDLQGLHISPEPSFVHNAANTAVYALCHGVVGKAASHSEAGETEVRQVIPRDAKFSARRGKKLSTCQMARHTMAITSRTSDGNVGDVAGTISADCRTENGRDESSKLPTKEEEEEEKEEEEVEGREKNDGECALRNFEDAKALEIRSRAINRDAVNIDAMENAGFDDGDKIEIDCRDNAIVCAESAKTLDRRGDFENRDGPRSGGNIADMIPTQKQHNQSAPPSAGDVRGKICFPRRESNALRRREIERSNAKLRRTIDESPTNTLGDGEKWNKANAVTVEDIYREPSLSNVFDDPRTDGAVNNVDLYRPRVDSLNSILLTNDKKIARIARQAKVFAESLSKPAFAKYKLDKDSGQVSQSYRKELDDELPVDKNCKSTIALNEAALPLSADADARNGDLPVAPEIHHTDANTREISSAETKLSHFTRESSYRSGCSKNTDASTLYPMSEPSNGSAKSRNDGTRLLKVTAHSGQLSESSADNSDSTTFSGILPALSSTRAESCCGGKERVTRSDDTLDDHRANTKSRVAPANQFSQRQPDYSPKKHVDSVFARVLQDLRDTSGSGTDKFIAYILHNEKRKIGRKIACAVEDSAIMSSAVRRLLDNLRKTEVHANTRHLETLSALKNILISMKERAYANSNAERKANNGEKVCSPNASDSSVGKNEVASVIEESIPRGNSAQPIKSKVNSSDEIVDIPDKIQRGDEHLSGISDCQENIRSATHSGSVLRLAKSSKVNRDSYSEGESLKQISDIHSNDEENPDISRQRSFPGVASGRSNEEYIIEANGLETALDRNEGNAKNNEKRNFQLDDVRNDEDFLCKNVDANERIPEAIANRINDAQLKISEEVSVAATEIIEEAQVDRKISSVTEVSAIDSREVDREDLAKNNIHSTRSLTKENLDEKGVSLEQSASTDNERISRVNSSDSLRDPVMSDALLSAKSNKSSLKEIEGENRGNRLNITGKGCSSKDAKEIQDDNAALAATTNDRDKIGYSEPLKSSIDNNERYSIIARDTCKKSLSLSNCSGDGISLGEDCRSNSDASSAGEKIKISSEMSHSEGELYMPSSCSYSLGEVRVLEKCDLIADGTIDRDSSVTFLVTRSMLTSLNDSATSLL